MGHNTGIEEIKQCYLFARRVDWKHIRQTPAPIRIEVRGISDTSNFDDFGDADLTNCENSPPSQPSLHMYGF